MNCPSCQTANKAGARGCRRCRKALPKLAPGDVVADRFEIQSLLGTGGMGVVFKARDRTLDEVVALKTLREDLDGVDDVALRFRSEIRLARRVSSRHVCRIHEYGIDGDRHYISMECVDGVTLKDLTQEAGGLPVDVAFDIVDQILAGLTAIHDSGIMHRDVKPSNLMRTRAGVVKLMDFGIAKQLGGVTLTAAGQAIGTPEYMSPEQVTGRKSDLRTDVYTTGIVIFELFTGLSAFRGETPLETAHKQVTQMPDFQAPGIPPALVPVLSQALSKDREARFASARELSRALRRVRGELDIPSVPVVRAVAPKKASVSRPEPVTSPGRPRVSTAPVARAVAPKKASVPRPEPVTSPTRRPRVSTAESQAMMPPPVTAVIRALRGPDPVAKRRAVLTLAEMGPSSQAAVRALAEALKDREGRVRFMAAAALGRVGPGAEVAIPALLRALNDEAAGDAAAGSLVQIGRAAVPALLEVMRSGHTRLSAHAASALTRIGAGLSKRGD